MEQLITFNQLQMQFVYHRKPPQEREKKLFHPPTESTYTDVMAQISRRH